MLALPVTFTVPWGIKIKAAGMALPLNESFWVAAAQLLGESPPLATIAKRSAS